MIFRALHRFICWLLTPPELREDPKRPSSPEHPAYVRRGDAWFKAPPLVDAPVVFIGWQDPCGKSLPPIELWNLVRPIPGYAEGSTLSRQTLERLGYWVPLPPSQCPKFSK